MQIHVEETKRLRRASASIRDSGIIHVKVPHHWPRPVKASTIEQLVSRLERKDAQEKALLLKAERQSRLTLATQPELEEYVRQINAETLNVPLGKVQIGYARYNHLAQVNLRTKTMTVSRYCLHNAPADGLRYLIIHELAHYYESGHGPEFWALVARHVPDYRLQSRIMKAFHHQAVIQESIAETTAELLRDPELIAPQPKPVKSGYANKPCLKPKPIKTPGSANQRKRKSEKTGFIPDLMRQLVLWGHN